MVLRHRRWAWSLRAGTVWLGWSELPVTKVGNGPDWALMGLAQEA